MFLIKKAVLAFLLAGLFFSCTPSKEKEKPAVQVASDSLQKGIGKFENVTLTANIKSLRADSGARIFLKKCASCHNLTEDRLVGPGWHGVTKRRDPAWILNFLTNVEEMIDKDPAAQVMMENCMVRMPDPGLSEPEAFAVLEFMRRNDLTED